MNFTISRNICLDRISYHDIKDFVIFLRFRIILRKYIKICFCMRKHICSVGNRKIEDEKA